MNRFDKLCQRVKQDDPSLTILMLNGAGIGNAGAKLLAEGIRRNSHLVVLFLDHNEISASGITALAPSLARHPCLEFIFLSYNPIGDSGALAMAEALTNSRKRLKVLKMTDCSIKVEGAKHLARMLAADSTVSGNDDNSSALLLEKLDLDGNAIGPAGAIAIADSLQHNTILQSISLRYNELHQQHAQSVVIESFVQALENNTTLTEFRIQEDDFCFPSSALSGVVETACQVLSHLLACNRAGRGHWGTSNDDACVQAYEWPRVISNCNRSSSSVLFALLTSRPDLVECNLSDADDDSPAGTQSPPAAEY